MSNPKSPKITRAPRGKQSPYFSISRHLAQDETISYEARGLMLYLLSKPDNWSANVKDLELTGLAGRDKVYRIIKELIDARYIENRQKVQNSKGQWQWTDYLIHEEPYPEKPYTGEPNTENTEIIEIREVENKDIQKKDLSLDSDATQTSKSEKPAITPNSSLNDSSNDSESLPAIVPKKEKKARPQDEIFNWLARYSFQFKKDAPISKGSAGRIGKLKKALMEFHQDMGTELTVVYLDKWLAWYRLEFNGVSVPRDPDKFIPHYERWYQEQKDKRNGQATSTQSTSDAEARRYAELQAVMEEQS